MRTAFHRQLDALTDSVAESCALAGGAMQRATDALLQADYRLTEGVIVDRDRIMLDAVRAEEKALALLALQAPVAGDLRIVVAALKNSADVRRMGALAHHVADIVRRRHPARVLPDEATDYFSEMGRLAVDLSKSARRALKSSDPLMAAQLSRDDDAIDGLHRQLFSLLTGHQWRHGVASIVDVTLLGRYYERFADHAVEIGRRVIFQARGEPMSVPGVIAKIVRFLRAGYPQGVPATDTFPLLALLRRRLSDDEVTQVAAQLAECGDLPVDVTTIRVMISKITDQLPSQDEVERVKKYLESRGWPIKDEFPPPRAL
jgi:phosphate transport system regulatory protein PhoU